WSSDVCSSDLLTRRRDAGVARHAHRTGTHVHRQQAHPARTRRVPLDPPLLRQRLQVLRNRLRALDVEPPADLTNGWLVRVPLQVFDQIVEDPAFQSEERFGHHRLPWGGRGRGGWSGAARYKGGADRPTVTLAASPR